MTRPSVLLFCLRPDGHEKPEWFCFRCGAPVTRQKPGRRISVPGFKHYEAEHVIESDCSPKDVDE